MILSRKEVREITGLTLKEIGVDPENWMSHAIAFKEAALLISTSDEYSPPFPYYYNSGISLELALKALATAKSKTFEANHRLNDLAHLIGLKFTKDQECTLELLSELIIWSGRYPIPKKEGQWDNYLDMVQEKHVIRKREGNVGSTLANRKRFPTVGNFLVLWNIVESEYRLTIRPKV